MDVLKAYGWPMTADRAALLSIAATLPFSPQAELAPNLSLKLWAHPRGWVNSLASGERTHEGFGEAWRPSQTTFSLGRGGLSTGKRRAQSSSSSAGSKSEMRTLLPRLRSAPSGTRVTKHEGSGRWLARCTTAGREVYLGTVVGSWAQLPQMSS